MKLTAHTPLTSCPLGSTHESALARLWITSVEELISIKAALAETHGLLDDVDRSAGPIVSALSAVEAGIEPGRLEEITRARPGGSLGCLLDNQVMEAFRAYGRVRPARAAPAEAFTETLPAAVRLMDKMAAVRDQGERGACVAFGAVALREFLIDRKEDLSEQFLYWACKELDGFDGAGTYIHTAMSALAEYGVCGEALWPYNPSDEGDEGQGPPPANAVSRAEEYRLRSTRTVEPNLVIHYKHVLAGGDDTPGMPVVIATLAFRSWFFSSETHRTGKITMPLPGEDPHSGHAWCVVGYVDDDQAPGGGYFIIRNSWSAGWAPDSPEAPGHAVMPYEYVERYAVEAFTGPAKAVAAPRSTAPAVACDEVPAAQETAPTDKMAPYVRVLADEERDMDGKLWRAGTKVLCHPLEPSVFREDTSASRDEFERRYRAWTPETQRLVWFPAKVPPEWRGRLDKARSDSDQFLEAIQRNVLEARRELMPEIRQPLWTHLLPFAVKISRAGVAERLPDAPAEIARLHAGVPAEVPWPDNWQTELAGLNDLRVYRLEGTGSVIHVVSAFLTKMRFRRDDRPEILPPDQDMVHAVHERYKQWLQWQSGPKPSFTFFTLGSSAPWPAGVEPVAASDYWLIYSHGEDEGAWTSRMPECFSACPGLRRFMSRLKPETEDQRIARIKTVIDAYLATGDTAPIHVRYIRSQIDPPYAREAVEEALFKLQDRGDYRLFLTQRGELAIDQKLDAPGGKVTRKNYGRGWLKRNAAMLIGPLIGLGFWALRDLMTGHEFHLWSLAAAIPLAYMGRLIDRTVQRYVEAKE